MPLDQDPHDYHEEKEMSFLDHLEEASAPWAAAR